ncbi:DUF6069 family protein [Pseudonocardia sp. TRM90224]|uniref:DUF6069 family protein n=1 Tax=Pseudonocardia sp. TRM90224 TaxID=2812678 RepID=UPI001E452280|nr:DUF6069 family protein [Pseudonocardia sp. TRM90224]
MSVPTTAPVTATTTAVPSAGSLLRGGAVATVIAAGATTAVAAAGQAIGISGAISGSAIPPTGFATLTVIFSVLGLLIALGLRRFARHPRTTWVRTTVALTALSLVPDVIADADTATKALLMVTHLVAAAIVIPAVARRLRA